MGFRDAFESQIVHKMSSILDKTSIESIATFLLDGHPIAILLALVIAITLPVTLHWALYRKAASPSLSTFMLLGPSGAGKTAFLTVVCPL